MFGVERLQCFLVFYFNYEAFFLALAVSAIRIRCESTFTILSFYQIMNISFFKLDVDLAR